MQPFLRFLLFYTLLQYENTLCSSETIYHFGISIFWKFGLEYFQVLFYLFPIVIILHPPEKQIITSLQFFLSY